MTLRPPPRSVSQPLPSWLYMRIPRVRPAAAVRVQVHVRPQQQCAICARSQSPRRRARVALRPVRLKSMGLPPRWRSVPRPAARRNALRPPGDHVSLLRSLGPPPCLYPPRHAGQPRIVSGPGLAVLDPPSRSRHCGRRQAQSGRRTCWRECSTLPGLLRARSDDTQARRSLRSRAFSTPTSGVSESAQGARPAGLHAVAASSAAGARCNATSSTSSIRVT